MIVTDTRRGGTPLRLAAIANGLRALGWEILFISVLPAGEVLDDLEGDGFATASLELTGIAQLPSALVRLKRLVRGWRPDVIHSTLWHANVMGAVAARITSVPLIWGHASVDMEKSRTRIVVDRRLRRFPVCHVAVSEAVVEQLERREKMARERIRVIRAGVPVTPVTEAQRAEARARLGVHETARVLGWTGRLEPVKDVSSLVLAFLDLTEEWQLVIVGNGSQRKRIERIVRVAGVANRVHLVGEQRDVGQFLEALDVFALPSLWEGFPSALCEAMARRIPVVASAVGGVPEIVKNGENGFLVSPGDTVGLRTAIEAAYGRDDVALAGEQTVRGRLSPDVMIASHDDLWRRAAVNAKR
jgi:glycosyltransferase involved in cell wall biosynthesis